ncbi:hypothetical protein GCM10027157_01510 [Corynebacterium aquatimens]
MAFSSPVKVMRVIGVGAKVAVNRSQLIPWASSRSSFGSGREEGKRVFSGSLPDFVAGAGAVWEVKVRESEMVVVEKASKFDMIGRVLLRMCVVYGIRLLGWLGY